MNNLAETTNVIDEVIHARLLKNIDTYAAAANIPSGMLYHSLLETCLETEITYVKNHEFLNDEGIHGLCFSQIKNTASVHTRMMAMTAAYLRNFISARVSTAQDLVAQLKAPNYSAPTVLLIPNFFIGKAQGGKFADWDIPLLLGMLYNRQAAGLQTVIYVESMTGLGNEYGAVFVDHITTNYQITTE